jgi:GNAT superfamily N-acetyltransferase
VEIVEVGPGDPRLDGVYPVLRELRDQMTREQFDDWYAEGYPDGYRVAALYDEGECRAVIGYRVMTNFVHGRLLYIDDLITLSAFRSRGYGKALIAYANKVAAGAGCAYVSLDSGTQRRDAHRFYFREGYVITSFHFGRPLDEL